MEHENVNSVYSNDQSAAILSKRAPQPATQQPSTRSEEITLDYDYLHPISVCTKGIRTSNVRIERAKDTRWGENVHLEAILTSMSTTLHSRTHVESKINDDGEYTLILSVDWSIWDLGLTNAEIRIVLPTIDVVHPGIRVDIPNGAIGVTMLGSTHFKYLDLCTAHGPAHLSDVSADTIKLTAHNGNITVHDITSKQVDISGKAAWMDIDDVKSEELIASSSDAMISLKDIDARSVSASTTNARIGLGNVIAGTIVVSTTNGVITSSNVHATACDVKVTKGNIEGDWSAGKKLYLSTTEAKIAAQVFFDSDEQLEIVANSKNGPIQLDLPASFSGGFLMETTGYHKAFIHTRAGVKMQPVLHISQPDKKVGTIGDGSKKHSVRAITEDAPVTVNFGGL
ncbi:hypothetical protein GGI25_005355 [Coemansia spiralis]|uniref:DUF4097 domain-containing protein n=2 Tax=Coemansia TaxID=4863 RepID=A0A9W8KW67_9FUNG|nr:hypothetical protein EDC05_005329 [Coemansia umbellata]KAJ2619687.1 hypothetical protein GGI26_005639 [Coemansia sp. RSA 1358]KAJ2671804.1 hypothetical protein GGI25_005355 [Coemansia spiralis]